MLKTLGCLKLHKSQGLEVRPRSISVRIILISFWAFSLIIISIYIASLTSILISKRQVEPSIKSWEDLSKQTEIKYGVLKGGSSFSFIKDSDSPVFRRMFTFMENNPDGYVKSVSDGIQKVENSEGKYAFILESPMNDYYSRRNCNLRRAGDLVNPKQYAFAFPKGSALQEQINRSILKFGNSGKLKRLQNKWWNEMNISSSCMENEDYEIISAEISLKKILGLFIVLSIFAILALLIAVVELFLEHKNNQSPSKGSFGAYFKRKLRYGTTSPSNPETGTSGCQGKDTNVPSGAFEISTKPAEPPH